MTVGGTIGVGVLGKFGTAEIRFRDVAIFNNAFLVSSPAWRDGTVDDGGDARMETMSNAACCK